MNYNWKRLKNADIDEIAEKCGLNAEEKKILALRIKGCQLNYIADMLHCDRSTICRYSNLILNKISDYL